MSRRFGDDLQGPLLPLARDQRRDELPDEDVVALRVGTPAELAQPIEEGGPATPRPRLPALDQPQAGERGEVLPDRRGTHGQPLRELLGRLLLPDQEIQETPFGAFGKSVRAHGVAFHKFRLAYRKYLR